MNIVTINGTQYQIEWSQGVVVRRDGILVADYTDGFWTWINPKTSIASQDMDELLSVCAQFELRKVSELYRRKSV